jgi:hypothetical protein
MFPWYSSAMLILKSSRMVGLRMTKLTRGGSEAGDGANLMVTEKIAAAFEAVETLLTGGGLSIVIDRYREHITLNATRLAR